MNRMVAYFFILAWMLPTTGCSNFSKVIFTNKDLTGWSAFPLDKTSLWSVKDGIISCQGSDSTYLRSEKEYSNYHFHCEWRWPGNSGDCAVGLHITGPDMVRPNSIEVHLKSPEAGDLYLAGPNWSVSKMDLNLHTYSYPLVRIPKELADTENLIGQWNSLDIFCTDDSIRVFINGFPQNEVTHVNRNRGGISLISRGASIEFKNLYLNPLK